MKVQEVGKLGSWREKERALESRLLHCKTVYRAAAMSETQNNGVTRGTNARICRCCDSFLCNIYDRIYLYGKATEKENLDEKCRLLSNFMICQKCFRKTICLTKALFNFSTICCQSKKIEHEGTENAIGIETFFIDTRTTW